MTKIFIATPAYEGKVAVTYASALADTRLYLALNGIESMVRMYVAGALLVTARNELVKAFLETDATHMLCIDADIAWLPESVKKLIDCNEDFVGALYPARGKRSYVFRGVYGNEKQMTYSDKHLLEMECIPAGFMLLKRCVLEKMIAHFPELYYEPLVPTQSDQKGYALFSTELWDGKFWGEDFVFCHRARQAGFKIWIDPKIALDHAGVVGAFIESLLSKAP